MGHRECYRLIFEHEIIWEEEDHVNIVHVDRPITSRYYLSPLYPQELNTPEIFTLLSNKIYTFLDEMEETNEVNH